MGSGRRVLASLLRELDRWDFSGQHILDFGAGRGGMSSALREMAVEVVAVEPFGYRQLRHLDIPIYRDLDEFPAELQFDGIALIEVIEHLRDPRDLLRRLNLRLKPGGWLFLTTPKSPRSRRHAAWPGLKIGIQCRTHPVLHRADAPPHSFRTRLHYSSADSVDYSMSECFARAGYGYNPCFSCFIWAEAFDSSP